MKITVLSISIIIEEMGHDNRFKSPRYRKSAASITRNVEGLFTLVLFFRKIVWCTLLTALNCVHTFYCSPECTLMIYWVHLSTWMDDLLDKEISVTIQKKIFKIYYNKDRSRKLGGQWLLQYTLNGIITGQLSANYSLARYSLLTCCG